jgi:DNA-binding MurR/RpiR family transcriptional regulator
MKYIESSNICIEIFFSYLKTLTSGGAAMSETKKNHDLFEKLRQGLLDFPARQRHLCNFILDNYQQVAFMNVEELARASGVSPATVVRTTSHLGYESFHEFLDALKSVILPTKISLWWQVEESWKGKLKAEKSDRSILAETTLRNVESLQNSLTPLLLENFQRASEVLKNARKISILAFRSTQGIALYAYTLFCQFLPHVSLPGHSGSDDMYSHLADLSKEDVLLTLSVGGPHYAARTIEGAEFAHSREVPVILITTDIACPAAKFASVVLPVEPASGHYSTVSAMNVLDALIVVLGRHYRKTATTKLRTLEKLLQEKNITL